MRGFPGARAALLTAVLVVLPAACGPQGRGVAMTPPANSDPQLTARGFDAVSRMIGRDDVQGAAAAEFAAAELKAKRVFVVHDGSPAGPARAGPQAFYPGTDCVVQGYRKPSTAEPPPFALQAYDGAALGLEALARAIRA